MRGSALIGRVILGRLKNGSLIWPPGRLYGLAAGWPALLNGGPNALLRHLQRSHGFCTRTATPSLNFETMSAW